MSEPDPAARDPAVERDSAVDSDVVSVLAGIRLVVLDVDGTLTDGSVRYLGDEELVSFHVHDGAGLVWLREAGLTLAWITGRGSRAVEHRAKELGVRELFQHVQDKARVLSELQRRLDVAPAQTVAMGDDLVDLALLPLAFFVAPANARPEVRARARLVTRAAGGAGAVRELAERLLDARGVWQGRVRRMAGTTSGTASGTTE